MTRLLTTLGAFELDALGPILPHEHVAVDLRTEDERSGAHEPPSTEIVAVMRPRVEALRATGFAALVDPTPEGIGRRIDAIAELSRVTGFPIAVATGVYREPWIPRWVLEADDESLVDWFHRELTDGAGGTDVPAAFIKLSAGDEGMTPAERRILRCAARAARATGATIGSHTIRGDVVLEQLDVLESEGVPAQRFVWIHAQFDPPRHAEVAGRGAFLELDGIGAAPDDDTYLELVHGLLEAGHGDRMLLSQDRGWYDLAVPGGGTPAPYTYLAESFLPRLRESGLDADTIDRLTRVNPFRAFAR
jgi:phosphotriesterase-related protein